MRIKQLQIAILISALLCVAGSFLKLSYTQVPSKPYYHFFEMKIMNLVFYSESPGSVTVLLWRPPWDDPKKCCQNNEFCVMATRLDFAKREWYLQNHVVEGKTVSIFWTFLIPTSIAMIRRGFIRSREWTR